MILRRIQNCDQDADNAFSFGLVTDTLVQTGSDGATGQKAAGEVANGRYDYGKIVAAVPKAIVGCLVPEDLEDFSHSSQLRLVGRKTCQHKTNDN